MPDLKWPGVKNARKSSQQHPKAIGRAVPLEFTRKISSKTQICAHRSNFSAAC